MEEGSRPDRRELEDILRQVSELGRWRGALRLRGLDSHTCFVKELVRSVGPPRLPNYIQLLEDDVERSLHKPVERGKAEGDGEDAPRRPPSRTQHPRGLPTLPSPPFSVPRTLTISPGPEGLPVSAEQAVELRKILFGNTFRIFSYEWKKSSFRFREPNSELSYTLEAERGGTRAVHMVIQANIIKHLLFTPHADHRAGLPVYVHHGTPWGEGTGSGPDRRSGQCPVDGRRGSGCHRFPGDLRNELQPPTGLQSGQRHREVTPFSLQQKRGCSEFYPRTHSMFQGGRQSWCHPAALQSHLFQDHRQAKRGPGPHDLAAPAAESRQLRVSTGPRQDPPSPEPGPPLVLSGRKGFEVDMDMAVEPALLNLLLTGRATPNVFNGTVQYDENGRLLERPLRGVLTRSDIGYLHWSRERGGSGKLPEVGSMLKTPRLPIWVCCINGTCSVLFSPNRSLLSDWRMEHLFELYFYNGQPTQRSAALLTIDTHSHHWELKALDAHEDPEKRFPSVEMTIRTKWEGAAINWNGTVPFF